MNRSKILRLAMIALISLAAAAGAHAQLVPISTAGDPIVGIWGTNPGGNSQLATVGTNTGQYPPPQPPAAAIDGQLTSKYVNAGNGPLAIPAPNKGAGTGFYTQPAIGATFVNGIRFATADDGPERDPITIALEGTNATSNLNLGSSWVTIYTGDCGLGSTTARSTWGSTVLFSNSIAYTNYRMIVLTQRNAPTLPTAAAYSEFQLLGTPTAQFTSGVVSVDFKASTTAPTQTGAALIGRAGDYWNSVIGGIGPISAGLMRNTAGEITPLTISFYNWLGGHDSGTSNSFNGTSIGAMMQDYLVEPEAATATVTIGGLTPGGVYDLILYSNPDLGFPRGSNFAVNGVTQLALSQSTLPTLARGVNYVRFERAGADSFGQITVSSSYCSGTGPIYHEANLNGLQIQPGASSAVGACCHGLACTTTIPVDCTNGTFVGIATVCSPISRDGPVNVCCRADFDNNGASNVADIFRYLSAWFAGCP